MTKGQVWGVSMMRDEEDVAYDVLAHLDSEGLDGVIVANNRSTDSTHDELLRAQADLRMTVILLDDKEPGYWQSRKMTRLAQQAAISGAEWIVPFDADELWCADEGPLADVLRHSVADILEASMVSHVVTAIDPVGSPFKTMEWVWLNSPDYPKVAFRWRRGAVIAAGNHSVAMAGRKTTIRGLWIHHFQYRSESQLIGKLRNGAEAYAATTLPVGTGAHWRDLGARSVDELSEMWSAEHVLDAETLMDYARYFPAPFRKWAD